MGAVWWGVVVLSTLAACETSSTSSSDGSPSTPPTAAAAPTSQTPDDSAPAEASAPGTDTAGTPEGSAARSLVVDTLVPGAPIDPRLLGTNVPAWLGPDRLTADWFLDAIDRSGVTTIRMPGGTWSNAYDWAACEVGDDDGCFWTWAARPSDFIELLATTGTDGVWTLSANETAQQAAAAVAFFNGSPEDDTAIGVDRNGEDWGTAGQWAQLRVDGGHTEPAGIRWWEFGNEVYGGRPEAGGDECASFGWEDVWTCDGTEYVTGTESQDGYLAVRRAMLSVDPTIEVGAVGVADPDSWSSWGREVIDAAGDDLDFYVVHEYGFDSSPSADDAVDRPSGLWPGVAGTLRSELADDVGLAITEYNLVALEAGDQEHTMTTVANAFFLAETIGVLATEGVEMANQWNLANGTTGSGTDYGLVDAETGEPFPSFEAMAAWGRMGRELLPVSELPDGLRAFATRRDDRSLALLVLNPTDDPVDVELAPTGSWASASADFRTSDGPDDDSFDLLTGVPLEPVGAGYVLDLPGWSMALVEMVPGG